MLNEVKLIGHLGNDAELHYFQDGNCVCNFNLATNKKWKDRESGELQEKTTWHNVVIKNRSAETMSKYLKKGRQVFVEGELNYRSYEVDGVRKYITEIVVQEVKLLGSVNN